MPVYPRSLHLQRPIIYTWSDVDAETHQTLDSAYDEVVNWKRNIFKLPMGRSGKALRPGVIPSFSSVYAEASALQSVALIAVMVMPSLLQRPHRFSKTRNHVACLERRLGLWEVGDINSLLLEGRSIQYHPCSTSGDTQDISWNFTKLMQTGKTKDVIHILSDQGKGRVLHLSDTGGVASGTNTHTLLSISSTQS